MKFLSFYHQQRHNPIKWSINVLCSTGGKLHPEGEQQDVGHQFDRESSDGRQGVHGVRQGALLHPPTAEVREQQLRDPLHLRAGPLTPKGQRPNRGQNTTTPTMIQHCCRKPDSLREHTIDPSKEIHVP